jgi:TP901 family phage tail tape measure protein
MAAVLEARAVITATDETGKAFDSIKARIAGLDKTVQLMNQAMGSVGPVAKQVGAISGQIDRTSAAMKTMGEAGRSVAGVAGAISTVDRASAKMAGSVGKSSQAVLALSRDLSSAEGKLRAISDFRGASRSLDEASLAFRRGQQEVRRLSAEVANAEHPTKSLQAALAGAEVDLARLNAAFKAEGNAVRFATSELAEAGVPINRLRSEQQRLAASIEQTTAAIKQQAQADHLAAEAADRAAVAERRQATAQRHGGTAQRAHGGGHGALGTVAEMASLYGTFEAAELAHHVVETYDHFDKERRYGKVVMGLTDEEQKPLVDQAIVESGKSKFNDIQWLETQRELAARGYGKDQVLGFTPTVASMGAAFDVSMPEAVKGLEGAMLSFRKDTSTLEKAHEAATRTADLQVKASKISGMTFEDVVQLYKYGAAPAQMAHLSEENLLAFGAISKKSNMGGDESGVAFRALAKNLISPTAGAQVAMRAAGIDYNKFQQTPDSLDTAGFVDTVAKKYGVALDAKATAAIDKVFHDKAIFGSAAKFMPAIREVLGDVLGGDDAKSKGKIANMAGSYRDASMKGVDTNGLMAEVIQGISKNPALANAIFGSKQGGRIFAALGEPDVLNHILDELKNHSQGFAAKVGEDRMAGFDGALSRLQNSMKNVYTGLGRAFDEGGKGGLLTDVTSGLAHLTQAFAEAPPQVQRAVAAISAVGAVAGALKGFGVLKGGFGLNASAVALDGSASALDAAAARLGAGGGIPGEHGGPGGPVKEAEKDAGGFMGKLKGALPMFATAGAILGAGAFVADAMLFERDHNKALVDGGRPDVQPWDNNLGLPGVDTVQPDPVPARSPLMVQHPRDGGAPATVPEASRSVPLPPERPKDLSASAIVPEPVPARAAPSIERRTFGRYLHTVRPEAEAGRMPAATPAPLPAGPIPVHIVSSSVERMPMGPLGPGLHRDFTLGNNTGGFGSPGMGSTDHFDQGPRRGPNLSMLDAHPVEPHVDDSELVALEGKLTEVGQRAQAVGATPISIKADSSSIEAMIGLLSRAISLKAQLGGMPAGGGTSGAVGTSYPQTAPTGRQGGPR